MRSVKTGLIYLLYVKSKHNPQDVIFHNDLLDQNPYVFFPDALVVLLVSFKLENVVVGAIALGQQFQSHDHCESKVSYFPVPLELKDSPIISASPEIMGGTIVFAGTRVPVQTLLDYLKAGESIDDFLDGFPTVTKEQVIALLEEAGKQFASMVAQHETLVG